MRPGSLSLDAFLTRRAADRRLARLTHDMPLPEARALEFGPGCNTARSRAARPRATPPSSFGTTT
ncbi:MULTISPECIES: hypothetical protein [Methylobacterium]|uniref:Uncharacterized protein n=1 Tax=Methylobacterium ajmalii TaxID=2738439 RepID=A0ABU9ZST9_9HYPH|nr:MULTISPECIES: hypothetical protein [Methylobacterium]MBK3400017.1 hypothetical protein [Methylobacterium ajmalii]MBK3409386.1 hypothetical protein [Methylobacterium ajmalii]MBK3426839.1 hypothetical protein [Methylobacterium ajmalii]